MKTSLPFLQKFYHRFQSRPLITLACVSMVLCSFLSFQNLQIQDKFRRLIEVQPKHIPKHKNLLHMGSTTSHLINHCFSRSNTPTRKKKNKKKMLFQCPFSVNVASMSLFIHKIQVGMTQHCAVIDIIDLCLYCYSL